MREWILKNELDSWWADRPEESNIEFELEFRGNVPLGAKGNHVKKLCRNSTETKQSMQMSHITPQRN